MWTAILTLLGYVAKAGTWFLAFFQARKKKKAENYEKIEKKIEKDAPVADVQSGIDDMLNGL